MYLWQNPDWPKFCWDERKISSLLVRVSRDQGRLLGKMEALGGVQRNAINLHIQAQNVVKSGELSGLSLDPGEVYSALATIFDQPTSVHISNNPLINGMVTIQKEMAENYNHRVTTNKLVKWISHISSNNVKNSHNKKTMWRSDNADQSHTAPSARESSNARLAGFPASQVASETSEFLRWIENTADVDLLLKAGIVQLWFFTIQPFSCGNNRIARAISDMIIGRNVPGGQSYFSLSTQLAMERIDYSVNLEKAYRGGIDISEWLSWFLHCLHRAVVSANESIDTVLLKGGFWERLAKSNLNIRQAHVLNRMLDGFEGKLTSSKWAKLTNCSQNTARRDITDLIKKGALRKYPDGGRSTSYYIVFDDE